MNNSFSDVKLTPLDETILKTEKISQQETNNLLQSIAPFIATLLSTDEYSQNAISNYSGSPTTEQRLDFRISLALEKLRDMAYLSSKLQQSPAFATALVNATFEKIEAYGSAQVHRKSIKGAIKDSKSNITKAEKGIDKRGKFQISGLDER